MRGYVALWVLAAACSKTEPNEGKRLPQPPPSAKGDLPANLSISVAVDGAEKPAITRASLTALEPDWSDPHRKAWRISRVVGSADTPDTWYSITGTASNITVELPAISPRHALVPALLLSQRGTIVAQFIDPKDPFPSFHGEGGRLGRSPEDEPRIAGVVRIEVRHRAP